MILKSISYDNLPHPDYLSRLKFHVLEPFRHCTSVRALEQTLREFRRARAHTDTHTHTHTHKPHP